MFRSLNRLQKERRRKVYQASSVRSSKAQRILLGSRYRILRPTSNVNSVCHKPRTTYLCKHSGLPSWQEGIRSKWPKYLSFWCGKVFYTRPLASSLQFNLSTNEKALGSLREVLLCIRLWSTTNPICDPCFTKTSDSFDLVAKLFDIITKQGDKAFDEEHNGKGPHFNFICPVINKDNLQMIAFAFPARWWSHLSTCWPGRGASPHWPLPPPLRTEPQCRLSFRSSRRRRRRWLLQRWLRTRTRNLLDSRGRWTRDTW